MDQRIKAALLRRRSKWDAAHTAIREAALIAAAERWKKQLAQLLATKPSLSDVVQDALTLDVRVIATLAELHRRGDGIQYIVEDLQVLAPFRSASK